MVTGCVEEVILNKETSKTERMRNCMEPSNPHNKSSIFSYFAPMITERQGKFMTIFAEID